MPAVSVIIPVYNVEPYVARCVRSLFGQTLKDIEYIFIDDCTPDRSIEVLREVLKEYPERKEQVRVYRMPQNSGQARVRMQGLSLVSGDYIIHCDADDFVDGQAYETMYCKAVSEDCDIVTCNFWKGNDSSWEFCTANSQPGQEIADIITGRVMGSLCLRMIRRSLCSDLVPPVGNMAEDMVIAIQITAKARKIGNVDNPFYSYYIRPDSISNRADMQAALARQRAFYLNARVAVEILESQYGFGERDANIVLFKYKTRHYLNPYVQYRRVYKQWCETFPEINMYFCKTNGIPFKEKFWYVLIRLHLYHAWKSVTNLFRR